MVLADQLVARVFGDLTELVVDIGDDPALVGDGDDGRLVERLPHLLEAIQRLLACGPLGGGLFGPSRQGAAIVRHGARADPHGEHFQRPVDRADPGAAAVGRDVHAGGNQERRRGADEQRFPVLAAHHEEQDGRDVECRHRHARRRQGIGQKMSAVSASAPARIHRGSRLAGGACGTAPRGWGMELIVPNGIQGVAGPEPVEWAVRPNFSTR